MSAGRFQSIPVFRLHPSTSAQTKASADRKQIFLRQSALSDDTSHCQNLIIPYIGGMEMQKLKPYHMENLYATLSKTPCGSYIEGKKQELTEKQKQRFLSALPSLLPAH